MSKTISNEKLFHSFCNGRKKKEPVYDDIYVLVKRMKYFIEEKSNHLSPSGLGVRNFLFLVDFWTSHEFMRNV